MLLSFFSESRSRKSVTRRSVGGFFSSKSKGKKVITTPLESISHRIKEVVTSSYEPVEYDPKQHLSTDVEIVPVKVGQKVYKVRKVFLCSHPYQVGWVVDCDLKECMGCELPFSWKKFRHHCRYINLI